MQSLTGRRTIQFIVQTGTHVRVKEALLIIILEQKSQTRQNRMLGSPTVKLLSGLRLLLWSKWEVTSREVISYTQKPHQVFRERNSQERGSQKQKNIVYVNLEKWYKWKDFQGRNIDSEIENRHVVTSGKGRMGPIGRIGLTYIYLGLPRSCYCHV